VVTPHQRERAGSGAQPAASLEAADSIDKILPKLWNVRCRNCTKEVFWRLATKALPTADSMSAAAGCICNAADPPPCTWAHILWQCPVAQAVLAAVQTELQARRQRQHQRQPPAVAAEKPQLQAADIRLARPQAGVFSGVWRLVCLIVVYACDPARRLVFAASSLVSGSGSLTCHALSTGTVPLERTAVRGAKRAGMCSCWHW
jgi:hypothetical protein